MPKENNVDRKVQFCAPDTLTGNIDGDGPGSFSLMENLHNGPLAVIRFVQNTLSSGPARTASAPSLRPLMDYLLDSGKRQFFSISFCKVSRL